VVERGVASLAGMDPTLDELVGRRLRSQGQRFTPLRRAVVEIVRSAAQPLAIHDILASSGRRLAQSSVYRNLVVLEQAGVVRRLVAAGGSARYEMAEEFTEHHHHLICTSCGSVEDLPAPAGLERTVKKATATLASRRGFRVRAHRVDMLGLCSRCD
jgi:Fe2+ or Zn2+ uptake regulation protein